MLAIVGLGNPGEQYAHSRHNAGFDVIDILSQKPSGQKAQVPRDGGRRRAGRAATCFNQAADVYEPFGHGGRRRAELV